MKLFHTPASPFVRKVTVTIIELGLSDRVEIVTTRWPHSWATRTVDVSPEFAAATPPGRIPALVTDDGLRLTESAVICEYLDAEFGGHRLLPATGPERWRILSLAAIANGLIEAQVARRAETLRRPEERSADFVVKMAERKARCYRDLDGAAAGFGSAPDIAQISCAVACGYSDFRYPEDGWRDTAPALARWYDRFAERPSMRATMPGETPT